MWKLGDISVDLRTFHLIFSFDKLKVRHILVVYLAYTDLGSVLNVAPPTLIIGLQTMSVWYNYSEQ